MLRVITNVLWYISNDILHRDLNILTVKEEIGIRIKTYKNRISNHPKTTTRHLISGSNNDRRLKKKTSRLADKLNHFSCFFFFFIVIVIIIIIAITIIIITIINVCVCQRTQMQVLFFCINILLNVLTGQIVITRN